MSTPNTLQAFQAEYERLFNLHNEEDLDGNERLIVAGFIISHTGIASSLDTVVGTLDQWRNGPWPVMRQIIEPDVIQESLPLYRAARAYQIALEQGPDAALLWKLSN